MEGVGGVVEGDIVASAASSSSEELCFLPDGPSYAPLVKDIDKMEQVSLVWDEL